MSNHDLFFSAMHLKSTAGISSFCVDHYYKLKVYSRMRAFVSPGEFLVIAFVHTFVLICVERSSVVQFFYSPQVVTDCLNTCGLFFCSMLPM